AAAAAWGHCSGKSGEPGCVSAGRTRSAHATPLAGSAHVLSRERLRQLVFGDDDDALLGDLEAAAAVVLQVVADGGVRLDFHILIDDGPADATVPADVHALKDDGILQQGEAVDANIGRQDAAADIAATDDAALTDHAVVGFAAAG